MSHLRYKEEVDRGFDILTNDPLVGPEASRTMYQARSTNPRGVWSKAMQTVNRGKYNHHLYHYEYRFLIRRQETGDRYDRRRKAKVVPIRLLLITKGTIEVFRRRT